jgi:hypothetical protein
VKRADDMTGLSKGGDLQGLIAGQARLYG